MAKEIAARDIQRVPTDPLWLRLLRRVQQSPTLLRDVGGLLLAALGIVTLCTLLGLNTGSLIARWTELLLRAFGFGAYIVSVVMVALCAPVLLRWSVRMTHALLWQIIWGELAFLAFLAVLHNLSFGVDPYELMTQGAGGGAVGWVLSLMAWRVFKIDPAAGISAGRVLVLLGWFVLLVLTAWRAFLPIMAGQSLLERRPARRALEEDADLAEAEPTPLVWEPEQETSRGGKGQQLHLPEASEPKPTRRRAKQAEPVEEADATVQPKADKTKQLQPIADIKSNPTIIQMGEATAPAKEKSSKGKAKAAPKPLLPRPDTLPPIDLLKNVRNTKTSDADVQKQADVIETTLAHFGLVGKVVEIRRGPTVTQFGIEPGYLERTGPNGEKRQQKIRVSQIAALQNDFALSLSAASLRIEAPIPGRGLVGIEVPNTSTTTVDLRSLIESDAFRKVAEKSPLAFALGRDVSGTPIAADLARMPHLLIAGTTGSGKSVCISALCICLAMNNRPEDMKFVMIDPKMVELTRFAGLPHIIGKPESEMERIPAVLRWVTREMDSRYKKFAEVGSRNLLDYNELLKRRGEETLPRIVVMIDELADLMMQSPIETEKTLCRLAQMARATGIHMVVATQRPSVDVVTGLIKANFPARISFSVASSTDSRVILDQVGAESLLGRGDMLFLNPEAGTPMRVQGCWVSEKETDKVLDWWKAEIEKEKEELRSQMPEEEAAPEEYVANRKPELDTPWDMVVAEIAHERAMASTGRGSGRGGSGGGDDDDGGDDDLVKRAMDIIQTSGSVSTSLLQRKLRIGYPRAARLMEELQEMGYVGGASKQAGKGREVKPQTAEEDA